MKKGIVIVVQSMMGASWMNSIMDTTFIRGNKYEEKERKYVGTDTK